MRPLIAVLALFLSPAVVAACLWDRDTLRDEQRGLPDVAAVLAGRWERHSDFFYEQRAEASRQRLAERPGDLAAADDLAVALEKLGRTDEAIAVAREQLERDPDRYETHANLGTFLLHRFMASGERADLDAGIGHIGRAIEINPDAHFGREKYQLMLAERVRDELDGGEFGGSFVMPVIFDALGGQPTTRSADVGRRMQTLRISTAKRDGDQPATDHAVEGVVGMIRFGTGTSPRLYAALGDLLAARGDAQLAARAYLLAAEFGHPDPAAVDEAANDVLQTVEKYDGEGGVSRLAAKLADERAAGAAWVAAYQAREDELLRRGLDVDAPANFAAFYREHGQPDRLTADWEMPYWWRMGLIAAAVGVALLLILGRARLGRAAAGQTADQRADGGVTVDGLPRSGRPATMAAPASR